MVKVNQNFLFSPFSSCRPPAPVLPESECREHYPRDLHQSSRLCFAAMMYVAVQRLYGDYSKNYRYLARAVNSVTTYYFETGTYVLL